MKSLLNALVISYQLPKLNQVTLMNNQTASFLRARTISTVTSTLWWVLPRSQVAWWSQMTSTVLTKILVKTTTTRPIQMARHHPRWRHRHKWTWHFSAKRKLRARQESRTVRQSQTRKDRGRLTPRGTRRGKFNSVQIIFQRICIINPDLVRWRCLI